jgi:lambda repressor-like predicted transcriptional regulator
MSQLHEHHVVHLLFQTMRLGISLKLLNCQTTVESNALKIIRKRLWRPHPKKIVELLGVVGVAQQAVR